MEHQRERRVVGVRRVPLDRIVDICTSNSPTSAFQARSIDVSGRGMHVRSTHVPALSTPLVLRFQEHGSEIIAEGEVAWRSERTPGGEFGVRFTALDSRSVQALKALCHVDASPVPSEPVDSDEHDTERAPEAAVGVHLHIAGLPTPMRADIKGTHQRRLEVASPLEFLRVGRNLEVEDLGVGARREARIDAVEVAVDEVSRIPELIVSVRYADVPDTPIPAPTQPQHVLTRARVAERLQTEEQVGVVAPLTGSAAAHETDADAEDGSYDGALDGVEPRRESRARQGADERDGSDEAPAAADERDGIDVTLEGADERDGSDEALEGADASLAADERDSSHPDAALSEDFDEDDGPSESERLRERLDGVLRGLSSAARVASRQCQVVGHAASRGAHALVSRARVAASAKSSSRFPAPPRRTAAAPRASLRHHPARQQQPRANGHRGVVQELEPGARRRRTRLIALGGLIASATLIAALVGRGEPAPESVSVAEPAAPPLAPASAAPASDVPGAAPDGEAGVPPVERARPVILPGDLESEGDDVGEARREMAQVPLFGPTSLGEEAEQKPAPPKERALSRVKVADQAFGDSAPPTPRPKGRASTEFGNGRLHLPIVYRLRLDQPGGSLRGERTPMGFDVVIAGRKTMESGAAISGRDSRIAKVVTRNGPEGTRVSFRFKKSTPAYKVRLRKDFVEFFISS